MSQFEFHAETCEEFSQIAHANIESLLKELDIDEKIALLSGDDFWHTVPVKRLGIPSVRLSDGPNGVRGTRFFGSIPSACLPCGTAIGATFDKDLSRKIGNLLGDEAKAKGAHVVLGPTINIPRGPLGGRGFESFSEDPVLSGVIAGHYCKGLKDKNIIATLKHFVCNDQEHERMAVSSIVTDRAMREIYLLPFMIAIRLGKPEAIMTAYNKVNGTHASESVKLLGDILRGEWAWDGLVMSDWFGTYSTSEAIMAGLDLEMPGPTRWRGSALNHAIASNKISTAVLDNRVRQVLKLVQRASKSGVPENAPETELNRDEDRELLRKVASDAIVLLKNEGHVLPLNKNRRIAVIGPNSKIATYSGGGSATLKPYEAITPFEGIAGSACAGVDFAQGVYAHQLLPVIGKQLRTENGLVGFSLKFFNDPPGAPRRELLEARYETDFSPFFLDYNHPNLRATWYADAEGYYTPGESGIYDFGLCVRGTGKLYIDGKLLINNADMQKPGPSFLGTGTVEEKESLELVAGQTYRILVQWGSEKTSKIRVPGVVYFGHGGFRLGAAKRISPEEGIEAAVKLASNVDQVVICAGLSSEWESEGEDRLNMKLPPHSDELISRVLDANPNTVIVIQSGTPVEMPWVAKAKSVLQAWYGGNECGHAIADIIFGDTNPSGKLPLTFPRTIKQNPTYLNYRSEGGRVLYGEDVYVGYRYYDELELEPLFPFGHGLSYTTFELSLLDLNRDRGMELEICVSIKNTGSRAGAEVIQVYVSPVSPPIKRPVKELKEFAKIYLEAGSQEDVRLNLDLVRATSFWDEKASSWRSEADTYRILVGTSSRGNFLESEVVLNETTFWSGL
ncbi:putative beta-glucosidase I [Talaromyces atroroseus]|uniref:beta-glucosidase n=1 Tax=Talaromyces atroroseus TaxID=1441469 RepID=A0A1Q5Q988_TALAT|nr:putative beta-glucosidase I [Talaromyces atroroseus]OKL60684.1 putative beta-glucosidase I [Talaromyces atroroseus]